MTWMARLWTGMLKVAPLRLWVLFGVGPVLTLGAIVYTGIVWKGDMTAGPPDLAQQRLEILGWGLLILLGNISLITIILGAVKARIDAPGGFGVNVGGESEDRPPPAEPTE